MKTKITIKLNRTPLPHGFTLVELLLTIGLISILIGLLLPALSSARASARDAACMIEMHQLSTRLSIYTDENRGYVPFIYHYDELTGQLVTPGGIDVPVGLFDTAADYWIYPMIDEYGYSYTNDALICPNDTVSEPYAEWASAEQGRPISEIILPLLRAISRSFYFTPAALHEDGVSGAESMNRVAKLSDVRYPSGKALLNEYLPFHEDFLVGDVFNVYTVPSYPNRLMVAASDLSVALRSNGDAVPPVLMNFEVPDSYLGTREEYLDLQRRSVTFEYTRDGVLGRDW